MWARKLAGGTLPARSAVPHTLGPRATFRGVILGIDPSLRATGLAIVTFNQDRSQSLVASCTVRNPQSYDLPACLGRIALAIHTLLDQHTVDAVAVEETIFVQNVRTAQILGAARGAAIAAAAMRNLPVAEYPPLRIKQAVTGFGRASKEQMTRQIQSMLQLAAPLPFDEADAAATALCHGFTSGSHGPASSVAGR
jgi:crossover junction endodeoxyribonuclease RuvC